MAGAILASLILVGILIFAMVAFAKKSRPENYNQSTQSPLSDTNSFEATVTRVIRTVDSPKKDASLEKMILGTKCRIEWFSDYLDVYKISDSEEQHDDPRRWVDVFVDNERYGYAWGEGYWTHNSDNLDRRGDIERWICEILNQNYESCLPHQLETLSTFEQAGEFCIRGKGPTFKVTAWIKKKRLCC